MNQNLNKISNLLVEYTKTLSSFIQENSQKGFKEDLDYFYIIVIIKITDVLGSIGIIGQSKNLESSFYSIGILLRSAILDSLIILYFNNFIEDKPDNEQVNLKEKIKTLYTDQLRITLKTEIKKIAEKSKQEKIDFCNTINNLYGHYLTAPIDYHTLNLQFKISGRFPDAFEIKKHITKNKNWANELCENYFFYSKLEHTGILTQKFYERIYINNQREGELYRIKNSLRIIINIININKVFLKNTNPELDEKLNNCYDDLIKIIN